MKISYNWLKDFVEFDIEPYTLSEELSLVGLEVEEVLESRLDYPGVVVGKVLKTEAHPYADNLVVCSVEVSNGELLSIVCGAPNVAEGQFVPVAKVGTELPIGMKIKKAKIRGVSSEGMICSEMELGLTEKSEGIWVLPHDLTMGKPLAEALDFQTDYIFDIGITPNRPDGLSHIGIAREVAALAGTTLNLPQACFAEINQPISKKVDVEIHCPTTCPRYAARLIDNVEIGKSPNWMIRRLESVGMRAINNVVDITNYVLLETGHPLHAFDFGLIEGDKIVVRESRAGEKFVTLDDKEHQLADGTVLICDAQKPVAIGGIMGGLNSEVNESTRTILLESAYFEPNSIRKSVRHLGITSEASQRFARGADPNGVRYAQDRATELFAKYTNGEVYEGVVDEYPRKIHPVKINLKTDQINTLLGTDLSTQEISDILAKISLNVENGKLIVPTYRPDIQTTADVAEEVARLYGYANIPVPTQTQLPYDNPFNQFDDYVDGIRNILVGLGCQEVITNSMVNSDKWEKLTGQILYPIFNPISQDMNALRNTLAPNLLEVVLRNYNRQARDIAIFEIGTVFYHPGDVEHRPEEELHLAIALSGKREGDSWLSTDELYDFYDIKGIVESFAAKISLDSIQFIAYDNFAVETQSMKIIADDQQIGYLGKVREQWQRHFDIENPVYVAEVNLQKIYDVSKAEKRYQEIPRFPYVERDLAVVVDRAVEAEQLIDTIRQKGGKYLKKAFVFDIYKGKQIEAHQKSMAFRLIFQSREKTLTEEEVNKSTDRILKALKKGFDANLRA